MKFTPRPFTSFACGIAAICFFLVASAFADNPVPSVVGPVSPQAVVPGSGGFTLKVYGANFVQGAVVNWNGSPRSTTFVSARELEAQILTSDVALPTAGYITVTNPAPGGGNSSSSYGLVEVHTPTASIVVDKPHVYSLGTNLFTADFNGDGNLDLGAGYDRDIKIWLGNGEGKFPHDWNATRNYCGGCPAL